jgi:predicted metal-dependent hydrolase
MLRLQQLSFDFSDTSTTAPAPTPEPGTPRRRKPAEPAPVRSKAAAPSAGLLDPLLSPAAFRHARANRQALLGDSLVAYALRRTRRRNIGFMVGPEGLTVSAPKWVPLYEVDAAVKSKSDWIVRKLGEASERHRSMESARIDWRDGASFPFLGEQVIVVLDPRHGFDEAGAVLNTDGESLPGVARLTLHVGLPHHAEGAQIRDAVQAWLMRQARRLFTERLEHFAPRLGVQWRKLVLSSAGTRWGTAHSDGSIRLNWRLVHYRLPVIDYVVVHELSHLRVMDHSPRFWETVGRVVPDYPRLRGELRKEPLPPW